MTEKPQCPVKNRAGLPAREAAAGELGWASFSRDIDEIVGRDFGLTQDPRECSDFDLAMHRHHAALCPAPHDYVAAGLANSYETQTLKCFDDRCPGGAGQLRHEREG